MPLARSSSLSASFSRAAYSALDERARKCLVLVSVRYSISPTWCGSMCLGWKYPVLVLAKSLTHYWSLALVRHMPCPGALVPKGAAEWTARHLPLDELLRLCVAEPCSTSALSVPSASPCAWQRPDHSARPPNRRLHGTEKPDRFDSCTDGGPPPGRDEGQHHRGAGQATRCRSSLRLASSTKDDRTALLLVDVVYRGGVYSPASPGKSL